MTPAKKAFIQSYINKVTDSLNAFHAADLEDKDQAEIDLFNVLFEVRNIFSNELPQIENAILAKSGTGERDANSVLGILRLFLIGEADTETLIGVSGTSEIPADDRKVFISHRSTDKKYAERLEAFLCQCGIPSRHIFCSSLPGNDVKQLISGEIKAAMKNSVANIVILSSEYYRSPYCLNEAGIIWFSDVDKIIIALPEIDENAMQGFLNSDHKLRRLDVKSDLFALADNLRPYFSSISSISTVKLNTNIDKLISDYKAIAGSEPKTDGIIQKDSMGYYSAKIAEVFKRPSDEHRFYRIDGLLRLEIAEDTSLDESHWVCDWHRKLNFNENDTIKFRVKSTQFKSSMNHGDQLIKNFRNITPENDIVKVSNGGGKV